VCAGEAGGPGLEAARIIAPAELAPGAATPEITAPSGRTYRSYAATALMQARAAPRTVGRLMLCWQLHPTGGSAAYAGCIDSIPSGAGNILAVLELHGTAETTWVWL
jgi:hypothetical protein